jgi:phytoene dehydrogenase-like protein
LLLGVRGEHPNLAQHNIFFNSAYASEFDAIFKHGRPPEDPTIYITITSKADPDHAPPGCENWFILVNAPPLGGNWDWTREADRYRDLILTRLAAHGADIRDRIVVERCLTPHDLERLTGARRGALYGTSSNTMLAAFQRPPNAVPDIPGLYFAGGTAHPGGGVPMVMLSGAAAARRVLRAHAL